MPSCCATSWRCSTIAWSCVRVPLRADGAVWRNRIQSYDSTFSLEPTDQIALHFNSQPTTHGGLAAAPVFDDTNLYWSEANPYGSVKTPNTGTSIAIQSVSAQDSFMQVQVRSSK